MRTWLVLTALLLWVADLSAGDDKLHRAGAGRIAGEYIVVLADDVLPSQVPAVAQELAAGHDIVLGRVWMHALKGFSGAMREERALALSHNPRVKFVEENAFWYLSGSHATNIDPRTCNPAAACATVVDDRLWHLDRIDQNSATPPMGLSTQTMARA